MLPSKYSAQRVTRFGGPDVLALQMLPLPSPGAGEVLVRVRAAGVNFLDVYQRTGYYPGDVPFTPGMEGTGEVVALGDGCADVQVGQNVAWAMVRGSYAEYAIVPAARLVPVPEAMDPVHAAATLLQGMTAHYLSHSTYPIQPGDSVIVHAAAGGAGLLLTQLARRCGAKHVIGTVSTAAKAELARAAGATDVILYTQDDFVAETRRITGGAGVHAVYDSVGADTFAKSLECLRPRGCMVLYGGSSGPVKSVDIAALNKGSLYVTRPTLNHYGTERSELLARSGDVLRWIASGELKLHIGATYPLAEAAQAQRDLESRATTGKLVLRVP